MLLNNCCGIDIGLKSIKVVQIERRNKTSIIKKYTEYEYPVKKCFLDDMSIISGILSEIRKTLSCRKCISAISVGKAYYRCIKMPEFTLKELKQVISWEAKDFDLMFNEEYVWDYEIIKKYEKGIQVLLTAAPKDLIMNYLRAFENSGLHLIALEVYPLATARFFSHVDRKNNIAVICFSEGNCEITFLEKGKLIYTRNINIDSQNLNNPGLVQELVLYISSFLNAKFFHEIDFKIDGVYLLGNTPNLALFEESFGQVVGFPILQLPQNIIGIQDITQRIDYMKYFNAIGLAMRG